MGFSQILRRFGRSQRLALLALAFVLAPGRVGFAQYPDPML
jgi:hypothetical protein